MDDWRTVFSPGHYNLRDRVSIANPETAEMLAKSFISSKSVATDSPKIIIEAFPGSSHNFRAGVGH